MKFAALLFAIFTAAMPVFATGHSSVQPISGYLTIQTCAGHGLSLGRDSVDFLPAAGGIGCMLSGNTTNVSYAGTILLHSVSGFIKDIGVPGSMPTGDFMTFGGTPLKFRLEGVGPGPANTTCSPVLDSAQPACALVAGSPFILGATPAGAVITLPLRGTVTDGVTTSTWMGSITTPLAGRTPAEIQASILAGQPVTSGFNGSFVINPPAAPPRTCTLTQGGYENRFNDLLLNFPGVPAGSRGMRLGTVFYTNAQLNQILQNNSVRGNGLISLAHQLITAKLNYAYGAIPAANVQNMIVSQAIAAADLLIGALMAPPLGNGYLAPSAASALTDVLAAYNEGRLGVLHCD